MARLEVYTDPRRFWDEVSPALAQEEARHCLPLGLAGFFRKDPKNCVYQSALFEGAQVVGALICSRYDANLNFLPALVRSAAHARLLLDAALDARVEMNGLIADKEWGNVFLDLFHEREFKSRLIMAQGIYRCDRVSMPASRPELGFRIAEEADVPVVSRWTGEFHDEAVPEDPVQDWEALARDKIRKGVIFLLERNGRPVSMAAWSRDIGTSCAVNLVYTPKDSRRRGYASLVTAKLTEHLLKSGKRETNLFTDLKNPTSNKIYQEIGYEWVCESIYYRIEPVIKR